MIDCTTRYTQNELGACGGGAEFSSAFLTKTSQNVLISYLQGILVGAEHCFGVVGLHAQDRRKLVLRFLREGVEL